MPDLGTDPAPAAASMLQGESLETRMTAAEAAITALQAATAAKKAMVTLPDITIPATALITLTGGSMTFMDQACVGVQAGDTLIVSPKSLPAGYGLRAFSSSGANKVTLACQCPILSIGGSPLVFGVLAAR